MTKPMTKSITQTSAPTLEPLQPEEQQELENIEVKIKMGWPTFLEIGRGLATVRDKKLYRAKYHSFEEYCLGELGFSRPYSYNLIGSTQVCDQMSSIEDIKVKPINEAQCRELIYVPEQKRPEAWKKAISVAGNAPVTAKIIREVVRPYKPWSKSRSKAKKRSQNKSDDLKMALKLLVKVEEAASKNGDQQIITDLVALRQCLESFTKK